MAQAKNLRMYAYGDLFIGFAIMAQPGYKTYIEFRSEGLTPEEALKNTLKQMIGKRVALSPSPPHRSFYRAYFCRLWITRYASNNC